MIANDREYEVTKAWIKEFEETLAKLASERSQPTDVSPQLVQAEEAGIRSILDELRQDVKRYESKQGRLTKRPRPRRTRSRSKSRTV